MADRNGWLDIYRDGKRLDRVIRKLEKKLRKCDNTDQLISLANSISYVTEKKFRIVDSCLAVKQLIRTGEKNNPGTHEKRFSRENIESETKNNADEKSCV